MQQSTINLPPAHPVRAMQGLARQISLPGEHAPERFPSFPALERTAVMGFSTPASLDVPVGTTTKMMLTRQASWPFWADYGTVSSSHSATWSLGRLVNVASDQEYTMQAGPDLVRWTAGPSSGSTVEPQVVSGPFMHSFAIVGVDAGLGPTPFIYVPSGFQWMFIITFNGNSYTQSVSAGVDFDRWCSPGEADSFTFASGGLLNQGGFASANSALAGYWIRPRRVTIAFSGPSAVADTQVYLTIVAGSDVMTYTPTPAGTGRVNVGATPARTFAPVVQPAEFRTSPLPWRSTRLTAASLLGTNVTQVLNKGGTVLCGRVSPQAVNPFLAISADVNNLHPAEKAWLPLETGVYTYCPPSTDLANFWDYSLNEAGGAEPCSVYRLDNDALVNLVFLTPVNVAETMAMTVSTHIEFRTTSALFQIALSGMTLESLHTAQLALAAAGFFFHNPDHKDVLNKVMSAVKTIAPMIHPALGVVANMVGKRSVSVPQAKMSMPATNAVSSGIVPAKANKQKGTKKKAKKVVVQRTGRKR